MAAVRTLGAEGIVLDIDVTPPWWRYPDYESKLAALGMVSGDTAGVDMESIYFGMDALRVRCNWPRDLTWEHARDWRCRVLAALDELPRAKAVVELYGKPWRVRFPDRAAVVYGCGHERAVDPTKPAVLDSEERCPTCAA